MLKEIRRIAGCLRDAVRYGWRCCRGVHAAIGSGDILDSYVPSAPGHQNALDIFAGEWHSAMPEAAGALEAGPLRLFDDVRIRWAVDLIGGVKGRTVLELGPLEAGHTILLEELGAASVLAVEANRRAFLKCLVVKEVAGLQRSRFLLGDCAEHLRATGEQYDICLASGILYHMVNPAELIRLIAGHCRHAIIWTHYFDEDRVRANSAIAHKFTGPAPAEHEGFRHTLHRYEYKAAIQGLGFPGGSADHSQWMSRDDLLACMKHFGFTSLAVEYEQPDHPNGPALVVIGSR